MTDFLLDPEPSYDRASFSSRIGAILASGWPRSVAVAPGAMSHPAGWTSQPDARLVLVLRGSQRYRWLDGQQARSRVLQVGDALWLAPGAPMRAEWTRPVHFLGIVLRPRFLRFLIGRKLEREPVAAASPFAHHTTLPLDEPGTLAARTLDQLAAGRGDRAAGPDQLRVLLRLCAEHAERCAAEPPSRAQLTWQRVQEHIAASCHESLDRDGSARVLGLNPTYLSDLCRRHAGCGFARAVEAVRLDRARLLLRAEPDMDVRSVAQRCGFASGGYFARVFRRATGQSPGAWRRAASSAG
ncbi:MAG: AraC family transcriptional regulator [Planctomycetes bacterium]|nr:AraC family transcriptional regulator [Planctomycetota bacterium]